MEELNLLDRFKREEERQELKMLLGILTVSTRYRDPTCCLHCIVIGNLDLLTMLRELIIPSLFDCLER